MQLLDNHKNEFEHFVKETLAALPDNASQQLKQMVNRFYHKVPLVDLRTLNPEEAANMVVSAEAFLQQRESGKPKIRVVSSEKTTIIEILNDDMPFLVDSISAEITRHALEIKRIIHPIMRVERDNEGKLVNISETGKPESFIRIETSRITRLAQEEKLVADLELLLKNVRYAVDDWQAMNGKIAEGMKDIQAASSHFAAEEIKEASDFLNWIANKNFIFLGYVEYDFYDSEGNKRLATVVDSELGIFKSDEGIHRPKGLEGLPPEILHFALVPHLIEITKSLLKSRVHRFVPMDYIGLKRFDANGKVIGERRFLGLFTSSVYYQSASDIPFIRRKIERVIERAGFSHTSHDGKTLKTIIEFTPRDELFQFPEEELFDYVMGVLSLETKPGVRLFIRRDIFERFVSCIVFLPREHFGSDIREEVQTILERHLAGKTSNFYTQMTDSPLVRLQVIISTQPGHIPDIKTDVIEQEISEKVGRWQEALYYALAEAQGNEQAEIISKTYRKAFSKNYIHDHTAQDAVLDIEKITSVLETGLTTLNLYRKEQDAENIVHLKWYNPGHPIPLSDIMPMLENAGFKVIDEHPYRITLAATQPEGSDTIWIRDFILEANHFSDSEPSTFRNLEVCLSKIWQNEAENDALNSLSLVAGFSWREVMLVRGYAKYLWQTNFPYGVSAISRSLVANPVIAKNLLKLFKARFDPETATSHEAMVAEIESKLSVVTNITDDKILRRLLAVILATLRTNYYQTDEQGGHKPYISFKFDSAKVPELPLPRPFAEIFVYSVRVEGIHLRGGKVARGGLRWSDRRDDFRTEVLGLVKAQMVKNSVIVPVGSKGGFVLKQAPQEREAFMAEGVACYKTFLSGLLDLTDNIVAGSIIPPKQVVRYDDNDPYLVVAADKGTATFSDYANAVSQSYGFWLGDAFASGGSVGYDHKKMAITAKGGFVAVARHFREMSHDIYNADFSVVGIGDMAGDVFGNGMLLSKHIRLVAAFNHLHIFLDPNPDTATSYAERERLFNLPRSSWKDYNAALISEGGGIYERSSKSITISPQMQAVLGVKENNFSPDDLIRAILLAPVDLLWNGGIGTYVKAEDETNEQVGDRANNGLRVNGKELRCKVIGEGGNLGFTQKGRIEYAGNGGRINTDAIDNSAGVDCSDHEVNIKIGLGTAVMTGKLPLDKRDVLLASMTEEVGQLVLRDNQLQTQAITLEQAHAANNLEEHLRMMHQFEWLALLDRAVEYLPTDKQLLERKNAGKGLTRPELAVLLAYSKMVLYPALLNSTLPDDAFFTQSLMEYFPTELGRQFEAEVTTHPLKREIIATVVANDLINHTSITFIHALAEDTGQAVADVARAYYVAVGAFDLTSLWNQVEALDGKVEVALQVQLLRTIVEFARHTTLWFLRNLAHPIDIAHAISEFKQGITAYAASYKFVISETIASSLKEQVEIWVAGSVGEELAGRIAELGILSSAPDVVRVNNELQRTITETGKLYFEIGSLFALDWLRAQAASLVTTSHWDALALSGIVSNLYDEQRRLTASVLKLGTIGEWQEANAADITRFGSFIADLRTSDSFSLTKLVIAEKKLKELGQR